MIKVLMKILQKAVDNGIIQDISIVEEYIDKFVHEEMSLKEIEDQIYEGKEPSIFYRDNLIDLVVDNPCQQVEKTATIFTKEEDVDPGALTKPIDKDPQSFTIESEKNNAKVIGNVELAINESDKNITQRALKSVEILQETNFDNRYEIKEEIGRGGMGSVYLVSDKSLMRTVAMKVHGLKNGNAEATKFTAISLEQFIKEARLNGLLVGENVLPIYEVGIIPKPNEDGNNNHRFPNGGIYYTMRYLESAKTLRDFLKAKGASKVDKFKMFRAFYKICTTMKHAHDQGFIHCDLKPDNIMFADISEELFVIDWGLSKLLGRKDNYERYSYMYTKWDELDGALYERGIPTLTLGGESAKVGTPKFMSPEQARGDIENFNETTDIYGLGGILYYMFTLQAPNHTKTIDIEDVLRRIASQDRSDRRDYSLIPEEVRDICKKCLAFKQEDRYQNIGNILEEFKNSGLIHDIRTIKKCIFCQQKVHGKFCTYCGKSIFCKGCQKPLSNNDKKFCSSCGRAFSPFTRIWRKFMPD